MSMTFEQNPLIFSVSVVGQAQETQEEPQKGNLKNRSSQSPVKERQIYNNSEKLFFEKVFFVQISNAEDKGLGFILTTVFDDNYC